MRDKNLELIIYLLTNQLVFQFLLWAIFLDSVIILIAVHIIRRVGFFGSNSKHLFDGKRTERVQTHVDLRLGTILYKLTRCVSSSRGSLTGRPVTALPFIARFLACWSDGEVELVDSTVTWTAGFLRGFVGPFSETRIRCVLLALGDRWNCFLLSGCSFDSDSSELLFSIEKRKTWQMLHVHC